LSSVAGGELGEGVDIICQEKLAEYGAIAAGAFDADSERAAELAEPVDECSVAVKTRWHGQLAQDLP
jgi:hypothetical protein